MAESTFLQRELRRRMQLRGLSARALSLKADLNETAVKAILAGKSRNPRSDTVSALARVLGCTVNDLLGPPGAPESPTDDGRGQMIDTLKGLLRLAEDPRYDAPPPRKKGQR